MQDSYFSRADQPPDEVECHANVLVPLGLSPIASAKNIYSLATQLWLEKHQTCSCEKSLLRRIVQGNIPCFTNCREISHLSSERTTINEAPFSFPLRIVSPSLSLAPASHTKTVTTSVGGIAPCGRPRHTVALRVASFSAVDFSVADIAASGLSIVFFPSILLSSIPSTTSVPRRPPFPKPPRPLTPLYVFSRISRNFLQQQQKRDQYPFTHPTLFPGVRDYHTVYRSSAGSDLDLIAAKCYTCVSSPRTPNRAKLVEIKGGPGLGPSETIV